MKTIVLLSGGLDSTTLLHYMKAQGEVKALTLLYGQKHQREVVCAETTCRKLGVEWTFLNMNSLRRVLRGTALVDTMVKVPEGHYTEEVMKFTVVPNRNMVFLSVAAMYALSEGYDTIAYAAHAGDHAIYPDCRQPFVDKVQEAINIGNEWYPPIKIVSPFMFFTKATILKMGLVLGVDYNMTWTCYVGYKNPCGKCGACVERAEAFATLGEKDPLYEKARS